VILGTGGRDLYHLGMRVIKEWSGVLAVIGRTCFWRAGLWPQAWYPPSSSDRWRSVMKKFLLIGALPTLCVIAIVIGLISMASFGQVNQLKKTEQLLDKQAEVSPGVWVKYQEYRTKWELGNGSWGAVHGGMASEKGKFWQTDSEWMSILWHGEDITWLGVGEPICLRAWKDELYLIVFDRDSVVNQARFRFYHQSHGVLAEIAAKDFPREIAAQNLCLTTQNGYRDGKPINEVEIAKALDPTSIDFQGSFTAKIWLQCETGKEYDPGRDVEQSFLESYLKKYAVVRLLEIQPNSTTKPAK
jgi:hypothetical protein